MKIKKIKKIKVMRKKIMKMVNRKKNQRIKGLQKRRKMTEILLKRLWKKYITMIHIKLDKGAWVVVR